MTQKKHLSKVVTGLNKHVGKINVNSNSNISLDMNYNHHNAKITSNQLLIKRDTTFIKYSTSDTDKSDGSSLLRKLNNMSSLQDYKIRGISITPTETESIENIKK